MVLNKEIQSQQRLDGLAEAPGLASPRQPRKALAASESYLQRLSMASRSSLWQEIPVVRNSTVLLSMTHEDQKLQEVPSGGGGGRGAQGTGGRGIGGEASHLSHPHLLLSTATTGTHSCLPSRRDLDCSLPPSCLSISLSYGPSATTCYWFQLTPGGHASEFGGGSVEPFRVAMRLERSNTYLAVHLVCGAEFDKR